MAGYKFPDPNKCTPDDPSFYCTQERVLALYNQYARRNGIPEAVRVSNTVQQWFHAEAHAHGWDGARFIKEIGAPGQARGCMLWNGFKSQTKTVFVMIDQNGNEVIEG
ncbi:hypothetical protein OII53_05980 [Achromobacter ruhlandii]|uniref:hypothetical protein n=1 Tax=Achromobacter ruhlandii TaxID=72557 RepID=UPI0021F1154D|nr:hypothetical protein [Achromobacter ruhlandii]MCV6795759.1 hypothetical protein [Achromobacter ruhlandii]MCV6800835.1 hypothetical protein [Achromobacter ruhlandii]MCV6807731.1 hypothetical protein [Achromobacter ruhlandii]MCV6818072.1 hypothetical protein [Achromobacter ruhlandii]